jgi:hypothetical protein
VRLCILLFVTTVTAAILAKRARVNGNWQLDRGEEGCEFPSLWKVSEATSPLKDTNPVESFVPA